MRKQITTNVDAPTMQLIEHLCKKLNVNKSELMRDFISYGIQSYMTVEEIEKII